MACAFGLEVRGQTHEDLAAQGVVNTGEGVAVAVGRAGDTDVVAVDDGRVDVEQVVHTGAQHQTVLDLIGEGQIEVVVGVKAAFDRVRGQVVEQRVRGQVVQGDRAQVAPVQRGRESSAAR